MTRPGAVPVAVFASGSGTNLQSLLDHEEAGARYRVALTVSDRPGAGALERARKAGRAAVVVPTKDRPTEDVEADTLAALSQAGVEAILLAGYLKLLPAGVVRAFSGRILNIHPALLPAFGGKGMYGRHVHEAVIRSGASVSGPTVHFVDEQYDTGAILAQWPVPVMADDTPETLGARVLAVEHILYPLAASELAKAVSRGGGRPRFEAAPAFIGAGHAPAALEAAIRSGFKD